MSIARLILALALVSLSTGALASPVAYALDRNRSEVAFTWSLGADPVRGQIAVAEADLILDLDAIGRSSVQVTLDARSVQAGFILATQALRGPGMFDTESYPRITFVSQSLTLTDAGVVVDGVLTIRDVTQPARMLATLYRQEGTVPGDRDRLAILLEGSINRHDFGASAWPEVVGPTVALRILAYIERTE